MIEVQSLSQKVEALRFYGRTEPCHIRDVKEITFCQDSPVLCAVYESDKKLKRR